MIIQDNVGQPDKAKVIPNREMLSTKIQLIKPYDEQILDSVHTDADMEREIFESSEFERSVSLELTLGNYGKAVAILISRFGDPQFAIQSNIFY